MVDKIKQGTLIKEENDTTVGTDAGTTRFTSPEFRDDTKGAHRTIIYYYSSVDIAAGGALLQVKDPTGTFRTFLSGNALTGGNLDYFLVDGPLGNAQVRIAPNVTAATSKTVLCWFISQ